jgi:CelD/BcsL family acetyltransferase involved in cellulose biosynthesis
MAKKYDLLLRTEYGRCAAIELPRTFEEFLRSLRPRFRTKVRSVLKQLADRQLTFEADVAPKDLRRRLRSLFELHQARWRSVGSVGVFEQKAKRRFYALFATRFARKGWLRLYSLRCGDNYLAHQFCFGTKGTTYLLQEGFDASNPTSRYGQMLRAAVLRHLIGTGERYDFLGGYSRHKEDWGATEGKTVHVTIARNCLRGRFYLKLPEWRDQSVSIAKRVLPRAVVRLIKRAVGWRSNLFLRR